MAKLTDRLIANLYIKLKKDYDESLKEHHTRVQIYNSLLGKLNQDLYNSNTLLGQLDFSDKTKAYTVLNTFFSSYVPQEEDKEKVVYTYTFDQKNPIVINVTTNYFIINEPPIYYFPIIGHSHHHNHSSEDCNSKEVGGVLMVLFALAIAVMLIMLTMLSIYSLSHAFADAIERLYYGEGNRYALISMSSAIISGIAANILANTFISSMFTSLAVGVGISPVGVVMAGMICLTIMGAALGNVITDCIQEEVIKNTDALDSKDPFRFQLTQKEEEHLLSKGYDPIKVKCAMVALRMEMGEKFPSTLSRFFSGGKEQELLQQVRKLRRGELATLEVGKKDKRQYFNFLCDKPADYVQVSTPPTAPPLTGNDNFYESHTF